MTTSEEAGRPGVPAYRAPLSRQHEFFCDLDLGDDEGAFGSKHTITFGWRVRGQVDPDALRQALDEVVRRHEMLRTSIPRVPGRRYQEIHEPTSVKLTVRELPSDRDPAARNLRAEELINDVEAAEYNVNELPHLRAVLGRFDNEDSVLALVVHHIAADGWSMRVIMRDLAVFYAAATGHPESDLPEAYQYSAYAIWQQENATDDSVTAARAYWREKLAGASILAVRTDAPRTEGEPSRYSTLRFLIDRELTSATLKLASALRGSPFMAFVAAYIVLLRNTTATKDIVVPTFTSSRGEDRFQNSVGPFLNFLPLRTDLAGCRTFRQVFERVRTTCLEAYTYDIPLAEIVPEAPQLMSSFGEENTDVIAFEVLQFPSAIDGEAVGDLRLYEIRRRLVSQPVSSDIPDGALWALDVLPSGETVGSIKYNSALFDDATMAKMVRDYEELLRELVGAPEAPLRTR